MVSHTSNGQNGNAQAMAPSPEIWRPKFLAHLRKTGNVAASADAAGVNYGSCYRARERSTQFKADWEEALQEAVDTLEAEAWRRGKDGVDKPVIYQGKLCYDDGEGGSGNQIVLKEYSDTLLITLLKAHRPQRFVPNIRTEISGPSGGPIQSEVKMDDAIRAAELAFISQLAKGAAE